MFTWKLIIVIVAGKMGKLTGSINLNVIWQATYI